MRDAAGDSAAWAAVLPGGTVWLPGHRRMAARRLCRALAGRPAGTSLAIAASPLAFRRDRGKGGPGTLRTYIAVPSRQSPVIVTSRDPAVLRYVADSVLSVPPGAGPLPSMALTAGLRLLRLPAAWILIAVLRAGRVVLLGRTR